MGKDIIQTEKKVQSNFETKIEAGEEFDKDVQVFNSANVYNCHHYAQNQLIKKTGSDDQEDV